MSDVELSADLEVSTKVPTTAELATAGLLQLPDPVAIAEANDWVIRVWDAENGTFPKATAEEISTRSVTLYASVNYTKPNVPPVVVPPNPPPVVTQTYMLTYNGNGNTGGSDPIDPVKYGKGVATSVLGFYTLTKNGSTFSGWNTKADGSGTKYAVGAGIVVNQSITLYAQWTPVAKPESDEDGPLGDEQLGANTI